MINLAVWQSFLQFSYSLVGDLIAAAQVKLPELLKLGHLLETRVGDLTWQVKLPELLELGYLFEARVGDLTGQVK